jgi:hypothetical protein
VVGVFRCFSGSDEVETEQGWFGGRSHECESACQPSLVPGASIVALQSAAGKGSRLADELNPSLCLAKNMAYDR